MKVLIVSNCEIDKQKPITNFDFDQSLSIMQNGVDAKIIALDCRTILHSKKITSFKKIIDGIEVVCSSLPVRIIPHGLKEAICKRKLLKLYEKYYKKWRPDIIHAQWGPNAYLISGVAKKYNIPIVVTEHCSLLNTDKPNKHYLKYAKLGYELSNKRICVSNAFKERLVANTGLSFDVLENVLDPLIFNKSFFAEHSRSNNQIRIISAGHFVKSKNFDQLVSSIALIKNVNYRLDIYGEGPEKKTIVKLIENLRLGNRVFVHNAVPRKELINAFLNSDIFILLSRSETFGVVFIEAMAAGLPVVSLECGGTNDIINDIRLGLIVHEKDTQGIANKIQDTLLNISQYNREYISNNSLQRYSSTEFAKKIINIYNEILSRKS